MCSAVSYFTAWFGKHVLDTWIQSYGNEEKKTVGIHSCSKDFQIDDLCPPNAPDVKLAFFELQETSLSACG